LAANYDIAIVGSGFAGSLMAMIAKRLGRSVVLIDKGKHPRVVIGESSTPLTNLLLEELAILYDLPAIKPLAKWGSWQRTYPEIACGLKRGFTFYHHDLTQPKTANPDRSHQLLVAASPNNQIADTHWYRSDFDHFLVRHAQEIGVDYFGEAQLTSLTEEDRGFTLRGCRGGNDLRFSAKFLIDASGQRGFLHNALRLEEADLPGFPATQALYSHFAGVERLDRLPFGTSDEQPPYPIDDAAVHHVFEGGWIWVLRFNNGITSAGVATTGTLASELKLSEGPEAWRRLLRRIPALEEQFKYATPTRPFTHIPRLWFRSKAMSGRNWAMLPSAAGFVDPLLSTGFPLTLLGVSQIAEILERDWDSDTLPARLHGYAAQSEGDLLAASRLIAALYANMDDFPVFSALSLLYFAAVSYAETARRLDKPHLAGSFLMRDHPGFGPQMRTLLERAHLPRSAQESTDLISAVHNAIEPYNVAGFGDARRRNWYPVRPDDLLSSARKVQSSEKEVALMLQKCGVELPAKDGLPSSGPSLATSAQHEPFSAPG
jgi:tetracycline 7-halogenase / FADH2 O2-dependent halogenase